MTTGGGSPLETSVSTTLSPRAATEPPPRSRLPRNVLALGVVSFFTDFSSEMIYPLLPLFLSGTLGASASVIGAIEGAAETVASVLKLASGWWSDRMRRRKPLVVLGYGIATLVRPLVALAQSANHVLFIRLTDRVGKGLRSAPRDALIADSVDAVSRGRAFGFHRAADHAGAVIGPLAAFALLRWFTPSLPTVFWLAAIPGVIAVVVLVIGVREVPRAVSPPKQVTARLGDKASLDGRFWSYLGVLLLFTLGNSSDVFLLLRANQLGVDNALIPILWAMLHVVKSASSTPGGAMSDRLGRKPLIVAGWLLYAATYFAFGMASSTWHVWVLFALYGLFFGLTEGTEKAMVADIVPAQSRGVAYGWYNLTLGLAALPASLLFGAIWDRFGAASAFQFGAFMAVLAAAGITFLVGGSSPVQRAQH